MWRIPLYREHARFCRKPRLQFNGRFIFDEGLILE